MRALRLPSEVQSAIRSAHPDLKKRIRIAIETIRNSPDLGKPLQRELSGWKSFRVGRTRIVYREVRSVIEVAAIGPRSSIYFDATRRLLDLDKL